MQDSQGQHDKDKKYRRQVGDLKEEIAAFQQERENFQKEISEGKLREKNYKKQLRMMERMPGNASMMKKIDRLHKVFTKLDQDGDARLTFDEFQAGAAELGFGDSMSEQRAAFDAMDKDND